MSVTKYNKWDDIDIDIKTLRGIYAYGFEVPSPIQSKAIEPIIKGNDVIAQAQSGTGKTGCFTIATLASIDITPSGSALNKVFNSLCSRSEGKNAVVRTSCTPSINRIEGIIF